jgi:uncharacterized protein (TIGR00297 family)
LDEAMAQEESKAVWTKAIPRARDRAQSRALVWTVLPLLCALAARAVGTALHPAGIDPYRRHFLLTALAISFVFSAGAWMLKAATPGGAACGGVACLLLAECNETWPGSLLHSALPPLALLFVLTSAATRYGRTKKEAHGLAEPRTGRHASQVIANLGVAALCAAWSHSLTQTASGIASAAAIAALAEATADTLSSEIGQAVGGPAYLITTLRRVPPGTDGAISLKGTLVGIAAAAVVAVSGAPAMHLTAIECAVVFAAGILGLFFDSLLGATLERKGWIGNDLVNFASTAVAAAVSLAAMRLLWTNLALWLLTTHN